MQRRNPLFVAGFPYILILIGYVGIQAVSNSGASDENIIKALLPLSILFLIGMGYQLFWQITTAKVLRAETEERIPPAILLVIPLANYWWIWRYSKAAEAYTKEKVSTILSFVLIAMIGSIGMGILQDIYNKMESNQDTNSPIIS